MIGRKLPQRGTTPPPRVGFGLGTASKQVYAPDTPVGDGNETKEEKMPDVMDIAKRALLTGIGLALTAKDEAEDLAKELEKKLNLNEEEGKKFLKDIQNRYEETQNKLESRVEKSVKDFLKKADIVTTDELKALKKEIRDLKQSISQTTGGAKEE
jgi:polyhydroxyalkanoate synthesis regulator phasin